jgi:putative ABC transport system permease protein
VTGFGLVLSSFRHRRLRTLFLVLSLSIAVGIFTLTLAVFTTCAMTLSSTAGANELVVQPLGEGDHFPIAYVDQIRKIPNAQIRWWTAIYHSSDGARFSFSVLGASDDYPEHTRDDGWFVTTPEDAEAWRRDRSGALVGYQTLEKMGWKVGDTVTLKVFHGFDQGMNPNTQDRQSAGELAVKVIGGATGYRTTYTLVHHDYIARQFKSDTVDTIDVSCPPEKCPDVADAIDDHFANSTEPTQTSSVNDFFERLMRLRSSVPEMLRSVTLLILLITVFVTANTVAMSLAERRAELATLRAIGYTRRRMLRLILLESALACGFGGLIGAGVPLLLFHHKGITVGQWALENVRVLPWMSLVGLGAAILLGLISALVPALAASRRDVVTAMAAN